MRAYYILMLITLTSFVSLSSCWSQKRKPSSPVKVSEETQACIECHKNVTPGIVADWLTSRHAGTSPERGQAKPVLERRVFSEGVPASLRSVAVGCFECHSQNPSSHKDNFEHFGYKINIIVSPNDCRECHTTEAEQYAEGKKAHALGNLKDNGVYQALLQVIDGVKIIEGSTMRHADASAATKHETCYACHGTEVEVQGVKTLTTSVGDIEVPNLINWPNQGVGRHNPDGSTGSCTACHPRHSFSIEIARKPFTCAQCHLEPDVPAWNVYEESKHGNIMLSRTSEQTWDSIPWTVGKDFRTPTCAACHNSLVVTPEGEVVAQRTHNFGARLWVRIFGLVYSHPQPKSGNTAIIKNKDGLPLPTTFTGLSASEYLIDKAEQERRQTEMKKVCQTCHSTDWTNGHFAKLETSNAEADSMVLAATTLLSQAWEKKLAEKSNPFDEAFEQMWIKQWLFYANSVRYSSAMAGPDYGTFQHGWWDLTHNLEEMRYYLETHPAEGR
jgi:hydroxylamine dehydrogenase